MRRTVALVALALFVPFAVAEEEPYVVLADWQEGHALVGTTPLATSPLAPSFPLAIDACHRSIFIDLLYDPSELAVDASGVGEVALAYDWLVEVTRGDEVVREARIGHSGFGHALGALDAGEHTLRLSLANGADVHWELRVRGWEIPTDPACGSPI